MDRQTLKTFFDRVTARLGFFPGEADFLCHWFEVARYLNRVGIDGALVMQLVADGWLSAYREQAEVHSLEEVCFAAEEMDTLPDRLYAEQGWVADRVFASQAVISPGWIDQWVQAGLITPQRDFGYVQYFDRAALVEVAARFDISVI